MSKTSEAFENEIVAMVNSHQGESLPAILPEWMADEGIIAKAKIIEARGIGSKSHLNKTDVVIYLDRGYPIKISAKLRNADYFGNWYGHKRFLKEFGEDAFANMTSAATIWANSWAKTATAPFVGVSICFGKRTGKTGQNFLDIFNNDDILTVARGYGDSDSTANSMYIEDSCAQSIPELIYSLQPITLDNLRNATQGFKVAYRPINPLTEGTNRAKNVYTRFQPYTSLPEPTLITTAHELFQLGEFVEVEPNCLNHNHILHELEERYRIVIPKKEQIKQGKEFSQKITK